MVSIYPNYNIEFRSHPYVTEGMFSCDGHFLFHPNVEDNNVTGAHFRFCGQQFFLNLGARKVDIPWFDFPKIPKSLKKYYQPHIINHHIAIRSHL
jgi:hypothetical protein